MTTRALRVAPRGNLSGIVSVAGLTLIVLPKHWREARAVLVVPPRGTAVCHELDTLVLVDDEGGPPAVDGVVAALLGAARAGRDESAPALVEEVAVPQVMNSDAPQFHEQSPDELLSLLELALRVDKSATTSPLFESYGGERDAVAGPGEAEGSARVLREILRAWQLVRLVEGRMGDIRRTYLSTRERIPLVRGRIVARDMFRAEFATDLDCEFEEFSEIAPLYRVVRTTLDVVVGDSARWGWFRGLPFASRILQGATGIQRQLGHISSMARVEAARVASQMRLGPTLRLWEPVRCQCASILGECIPADARSADGYDAGVGITINTAVLWQGLVHHAVRELGRQRPGVVPEDPPNVALWVGHPFKGKVVDSAFRHIDERWLLDAKYKDFPGESAPALEDQYQMFGYSHLYDEVTHVALLYPQALGMTQRTVSGTHRRGGRAGDCSIRWATAPFPERHVDTDADSNWRRAIGDVQEALAGLLDQEDGTSLGRHQLQPAERDSSASTSTAF
jgi:hypothetical protein